VCVVVVFGFENNVGRCKLPSAHLASLGMEDGREDKFPSAVAIKAPELPHQWNAL
jgi:hypothetical protein